MASHGLESITPSKPENVLRLDGRWVLADLGLVVPPTRETTTVTNTSSWAGSLTYMAPEQLHDFKHVRLQADIFSFGCILDDLIGNAPRLPFSRCTTDGPLAGGLEKCTEADSSKRFSSAASVRNALLIALDDSLREAAGEQKLDPAGEASQLVARLQEDPESLNFAEWRAAVRIAEDFRDDSGEAEARAVLRALDVDQLKRLHSLDIVLFERAAQTICDWASEGSFAFEYCDVLGSRLRFLYEISDLRGQAEAAIATLTLACSHNRFYVMRQWMRMAGPSAADDLADRLAIELAVLGPQALRRVEQIEHAIDVSRERLHPRVLAALSKISEQEDKTLFG